MIKTHYYKNQCWWCGAPANSREHRFKRTDLVREFGKGPFREPNKVTRVIRGQDQHIQGPNSNRTKYEPNLCDLCNKKRSQKFDYAYDAFTGYIKKNQDSIQANREFRFSEIFGKDWESQRKNIIKYYVKHICCRLAESRIYIEPILIQFLNGVSELKFLKMKLEVRQDIVALIQSWKVNRISDGNLWLGDLTYIENFATKNKGYASSFIGYRWLRLNYLYDNSIQSFANNFEGDIVKLSTDFNVEPQIVSQLTWP